MNIRTITSALALSLTFSAVALAQNANTTPATGTAAAEKARTDNVDNWFGRFDYNKDGKVDNPGFLDYRMPVCSDLPMIDTVMVEVPNPKHPQGVKGVGEVPLGGERAV